MGVLDRDEMVHIAKEWMQEQYDDFPSGIVRFGQQEFSPTPTVVLEDNLNIPLFIEIVEEEGYYTMMKQSRSGTRLIAVCEETPGEGNDIKFVFDEGCEHQLDSPRQFDEAPNRGRIALLVKYLEAKNCQNPPS